MRDRAVEASPQIYARIGGMLYLYIIVAGGFAEGFVRSRLIVPGDAIATANNIMAHESLWRIAFAGELILYVCAVSLVLVLYVLLSPVNRNIALLAAFLNLVSIAVEAVNALLHYTPLALLSGDSYLKPFETSQLQAFAFLALELHEYGFGISLTLFGFVLLILGYLIFKSEYFPKALGVLVLIASASYLTNSFALFLFPALEAAIFPTILLPALVGELSLCLWLLVRGVDLQRWEANASQRGATAVA